MRRYIPIILAVIVIAVIAVAAIYMTGDKDAKSGVAGTVTTDAGGDINADTEAGRTPIKGVAVVDVVALLRESSAAKSIESQLVEKRKAYQAELAGQEKKLKGMEDELVKMRDKQNTPEFAKKRKEFEKAVRDLQQNAQKKRMTLDKAANKAVSQLQNEITKITAEQANANGVQLVLTRDQVIVVSKPLDMTADIMERLNKDMPNVTVTTTEAAAPAAADGAKAE